MSEYQFSMMFNINVSNGSEITFQNIHYLFSSFGVPNTIIEIGCFEGRTTVFMADTYTKVDPNMTIYCVDPHDISFDLKDDISLVKQRFLNNLTLCDNKNIRYINKKSEDGLIDLINQNIKAQFIFVDGDHRGSTVLSDLVLGFKLLQVGGTILCDDVNWKHPGDGNIPDSPSMSPRMAVESFINVNWHRLNVINLPHSGQTAFIKTSD